MVDFAQGAQRVQGPAGLLNREDILHRGSCYTRDFVGGLIFIVQRDPGFVAHRVRKLSKGVPLMGLANIFAHRVPWFSPGPRKFRNWVTLVSSEKNLIGEFVSA